MKKAKLYKLKLTGVLLFVLLNYNNVRGQSDTIPPVITLVGLDTIWHEIGYPYTDPGASAFDEIDGDVTIYMLMTTDVDIKVTGIYTVRYDVKDKTGNNAKTAIRIVVMRNDLTLPVLSLNPGASGCIELSCDNAPYIDPGATAIDNMSPFNLSSYVMVSGNVDTRKKGIYTLTYTVQDVAGNKAIPVSRKVCVDATKTHGFIVTPISEGFRIWTDNAFEIARSSFKWYIDGNYLSGYDDKKELLFYPDDTNTHEACMAETFCKDDTAYNFCKIIGKKVDFAISGKIYLDTNKNCLKDGGEITLNNVTVRLFDSNGNLIATTISYNGTYEFNVEFGKYKVELDISGKPLEIKCSYPGKDTIIEIKQGQEIVKNLDFAVLCKPGFDIGIIYPPSRSFAIPGQTFEIDPHIGDLQALFGGGCNSNQKGKIKINVQGKVHFSGIDTNALYPDSIKTNDFIYIIDNFSLMDQKGIRLKFITDTLALIGDTVKVLISIETESGDNKTDNNVLLHRYIVRTSYDPNMKEVYPIDVEPAYSDWMTYTVHFQNTGNAQAFKVRITDTLDENLDPASFEVLGFSHTSQVGLKGRSIVFNFPNINLPDSFSDEKNSHGHFKYRVKPYKNLPEGTKIFNTAYIFFDYNKPVVTNTTVNTFVAPVVVVSINSEEVPGSFKLYPNPGSGVFTLEYSELIREGSIVEVYDIYGAILYSFPLATHGVIDLSAFANGFYICKLKNGSEEIYKSFIKQ